MAVSLTIRRGPKAGHAYTFHGDEITIGSGRNNDLIILDNDVSTEHCRLVRLDDDYEIEDLESRYGTFVNGQPAPRGWLLKSGTLIELGASVTLEFAVVNEEPEGPDEDELNSPVLVLVKEAVIKDAFLLQSPAISMGRAVNGNDIVIQSSDISRHHLKLELHDDTYYVQDLGSRNGTFVNGKPVEGTPVALTINDVLRLGSSTQLHYVRRADLPPEWDPDNESMPDNEGIHPTLPYNPVRNSTREMRSTLRRGALEDHVLVAYAREDWEEIVASLVLALQDSKQKVWVDQHLLPGSEAWTAAMQQAIIECWLLVVVVSPRALDTTHVREMYRYFYNRDKPILLVDYKEVERLPLHLGQQPRLAYDEENPGATFRRLIYEIMNRKGRKSS